MNNSISIIIPVFYSTDSLVQLCQQLVALFSNHSVEIILVDDGSSSPSWKIIKELKQQYGEKIIGIRLSKNFGQNNAIICGLNHCSKEFVVTLDDDLQFSPDSIGKLLEKMDDPAMDIIYGLPLEKKHSVWRNLGFRAMQFSVSVFNDEIPPASSFRIMRKSLADRLKHYRHYYLNIDALVRWHTDHIGYCEVPHHERKQRRSGYTNLGLINYAVRGIIAYSAIPLKLFFASFILALLLSAIILFAYFTDAPVARFLLIADALVFITMFALGFSLSFAYLFHILSFISNKPCYNIAEQI